MIDRQNRYSKYGRRTMTAAGRGQHEGVRAFIFSLHHLFYNFAAHANDQGFGEMFTWSDLAPYSSLLFVLFTSDDEDPSSGTCEAQYRDFAITVVKWLITHYKLSDVCLFHLSHKAINVFLPEPND